MKMISQHGAGGEAYGRSLQVAAHLSMRNQPTAKRHVVSITPRGGASRGLAEHDPRHKAAVKKAVEAGPLCGARAVWTDETTGDKYVVVEA